MKHSQTGFGTVGIITLIAIMFIGGTALILSGESQESDKTPEISQELANQANNGSRETVELAENGVSHETDSMMAENAVNDEMVVSQETTSDSSDSVSRGPGTFEDYSPEKLALAEAGDVVLFFHANWCPSCRALESDINANLSQIPDGVHLLKVDYDSETELKQKYGVVRQHTLVQVDASGNKIQDLTGLNNTLAQVVSQL